MDSLTVNDPASEVDNYYNRITFRYRDAELRHQFGLYVRRLTIDPVRLSVLYASQLAMMPLFVQWKAFRGEYGMLGMAFCIAEIQSILCLSFLFFTQWFSKQIEKAWKERIKAISLNDVRSYLIHWFVLNGPTGVGLAVNARLFTRCAPTSTLVESQYCSWSNTPLLTASCIMSMTLIILQWTFPMEWGMYALTWVLGAFSLFSSYWLMSVSGMGEVLINGIPTVFIHLTTLLVQYFMFARIMRAFRAEQAEVAENKAIFAMKADPMAVGLSAATARVGRCVDEANMCPERTKRDHPLPRRRTEYITRERPLFEDDDYDR